MKISPGIYAIHRRSDAEVQAQTLRDDDSGLSLTVGPLTDGSQFGSPAVTLVLSGAVENEDLGSFKVGEALVTDSAAELRAIAPGTNVVTVIYDKGTGPEGELAMRSREHTDWPVTEHPTPVEVLLTDPPSQHSLTLFSDPSGAFSAGLWSTTAYSRRSTVFPNFEMFHLLSGWIELKEDDGPNHRFTEGDTFLIAKGTQCDWRTGGMSKFACTHFPVG